MVERAAAETPGPGPLSGKICLVTGGTAGIGRITARALACMGARVIIVGRHAGAGADAATEISRAVAATTGNGSPADGNGGDSGGSVEFIACDLSSQAEIGRLAETLAERVRRLDVLLNNAGAMFGRRMLSADGIEMTFALNHLGYFLLTLRLLPLLREATPARIVNVASEAHRGITLRFDNLQGERRYMGWRAYQRSKLANLMFTFALARRVDPSALSVNALHPGFVATDIGTREGLMSKLAWRALTLAAITPEEGAKTSIHLASSPELAGQHGEYFIKCRPARAHAAACDERAQERLWQISAELTGVDADGLVAAAAGP
jgi:NAD(P)-dependent dehydrogenase (short-subunit alcohol dehydrogenase family)